MYAQVKGCIVVDLFPQLAEHVTVVIYDKKTAFANNFLLMNISLGDGFQTKTNSRQLGENVLERSSLTS